MPQKCLHCYKKQNKNNIFIEYAFFKYFLGLQEKTDKQLSHPRYFENVGSPPGPFQPLRQDNGDVKKKKKKNIKIKFISHV